MNPFFLGEETFNFTNSFYLVKQFDIPVEAEKGEYILQASCNIQWRNSLFFKLFYYKKTIYESTFIWIFSYLVIIS